MYCIVQIAMESYVSEEFESRLLPIPIDYTDMFTEGSASGSSGSAGAPGPGQNATIMLPIVKVIPTKKRRIAPVKRVKPRNPYSRLITTGEPSL